MKWIPPFIFLLSIYKGKDYAESFLNYSSATVTQVELQSVAQTISLNLIDGDIPRPENFSEYLRKSIRTKSDNSTRDVANDLWGTPYRLEISEKSYVVRSAGPDKNFGNSDDISISVSNRY